MSENLDPLDPLHEKSFVEGQKAVAKKVSARRYEEYVKTPDAKLAKAFGSDEEDRGTDIARQRDDQLPRARAVRSTGDPGDVEQQHHRGEKEGDDPDPQGHVERVGARRGGRHPEGGSHAAQSMADRLGLRSRRTALRWRRARADDT